MKCISVLEPRKFDAELSAVPVKRLNLSIVFLIGDIQVSVTSYILQNSPVVGFRNNVLEIRITSYNLSWSCIIIIASLILATLKATFLLAVLVLAIAM